MRWRQAVKSGNGSVRGLEDGKSFVIDDVDAYIRMVSESYGASEPPAVLHPRTERLIRDYVKSRDTFDGANGLPGYHAEARSLNDVFIADPDISLEDITIGTKALRRGPNAPDFPACSNCSGIIPSEVDIYTTRVSEGGE